MTVQFGSWPSTLRTVRFHPFRPSSLDLTPSTDWFSLTLNQRKWQIYWTEEKLSYCICSILRTSRIFWILELEYVWYLYHSIENSISYSVTSKFSKFYWNAHVKIRKFRFLKFHPFLEGNHLWVVPGIHGPKRWSAGTSEIFWKRWPKRTADCRHEKTGGPWIPG